MRDQMKTLVQTAILASTLGAALPALADEASVEQRLIDGLLADGYTIVEDGFTWLGRLRIVAQNGEVQREIVVNPATGEVLRDYAVALSELDAPTTAVASSGNAGTHGASGGNSGSLGASTGGHTGGAVATSVPPPAVKN